MLITAGYVADLYKTLDALLHSRFLAYTSCLIADLPLQRYARWVRKHPSLSSSTLPAVLLSAHPHSDISLQQLDVEALICPFSRTDLLECIALARHRCGSRRSSSHVASAISRRGGVPQAHQSRATQALLESQRPLHEATSANK
nr:hypothetical protein BDOA9_0203420 [Bradyrhizobium sp. DOA9]